MKNFLYLLLMLSTGAYAQEKIPLDTIFGNDSQNVSLFFPSTVRQAIVGAPNFTFSFNSERPQYFGLLKASPGPESNLLVITSDGQIYSYLLKYKAVLPGLNYFIPATQSIGNEVPQEQLEAGREKDSTELLVPRKEGISDDFGRLAAYYLERSTGKIKSKRKNGLKLTVCGMAYDGNEIYLLMELQNKSGIDFNLDYLNVYLTQGNRRRNASFQKVLQRPLFRYKFPEVVKDQQRIRFVYVLPKFTIGENERLEVEVREKRGSRYLKLNFREAKGQVFAAYSGK